MDHPPETTSLLSHFASLKDPRQRAKVVYPLPEILLLVLCATIAGAEDFVEITHWGETHMDFLRRFLPYYSLRVFGRVESTGKMLESLNSSPNT
jgi:hypothetical protein